MVFSFILVGISIISPKLQILGYLSASTRDGKSAISENHSKCKPNGSQATEAASIPEQILPTVVISKGIFSFHEFYMYVS